MDSADASDPRSEVERQRNARPESTMALDFSSALDGAFNLGGDIGDLHQTVEQKKQAVTSQSRELEALEARIKAAEERLHQVAAAQPSSTSGQQEQKTRVSPSPTKQRHRSSKSISNGASSKAVPLQPHAPGGLTITDRAPTPLDPSRGGRAMPGALPDTPSDAASAKDYYSRGRS